MEQRVHDRSGPFTIGADVKRLPHKAWSYRQYMRVKITHGHKYEIAAVMAVVVKAGRQKLYHRK